MRHCRFRRVIQAPIIAVGITLLAYCDALAQGVIEYRLSFPSAIHHVMNVEFTFRNVPLKMLQVQMSRSSPGRYAAFDFAKNVFNEHITDGQGKELSAIRPNAREWDVEGHNGTVRITYNVFGDKVDGTFLAVDTTHAHINFPAALMWARGHFDLTRRLPISASDDVC